MDMISTNLKKNDNVVIISGSDKGRRGKILFIDKEKGRVVVEGVNKKKKFVRPSQENPKGGVINLEYPLNISKVMLFCEKCKKGVRMGMQAKDSGKIRVCKKCGKSFDK
jgi:large subunit ribosomal protein L24